MMYRISCQKCNKGRQSEETIPLEYINDSTQHGELDKELFILKHKSYGVLRDIFHFVRLQLH